MLGPGPDAEDCAALALLQFVENPPVDVADLKALLVSISRRRAVDRLRTLERDRVRDGKLSRAWVAEIPDIAEAVVAGFEAHRIDSLARRSLTPRAYEVLSRVALGDRVTTVAADLEISGPAARSHLKRARRLLQQSVLKSFALMAMALGWCKRGFSRATRTVALGLPVASFMTIVVGVSPPPSGPGFGPVQDHPARPATSALLFRSRPFGPTTAARFAQVEKVNLPHLAQKDTVQPGQSTIVTVREPLGAKTAVRREHHGSQGSSGPVDTVLECLHHVEIDWHRIGC